MLHGAVSELQADICPDELLEPCAHSPELSHALGVHVTVSNRIRFYYSFIGAGDLLFFNLGTAACLVECCLLAGEEFALLVVPLVLQERITATTSRL